MEEANTLTPARALAPLPTANTRRLQVQYRWKSCCWDLDKRCVIFSTRVLFSAFILIFACFQIVRDSDGCSNSLLSWYCSLVGVVLGSFINIGKTKDEQIKGAVTV